MKYLPLGCGLFVILFIVLPIIGFATNVISLPFHAAGNAVDSLHGVIDKTITADNAIYNYEWFKQQKADIEAIQEKISVAQDSVTSFESSAGPRTAWSFEDKTEDSRLRSVAQGLQSQYRDMVATYNARSSMATRSIFQDGKIPQVMELGARFLK